MSKGTRICKHCHREITKLISLPEIWQVKNGYLSKYGNYYWVHCDTFGKKDLLGSPSYHEPIEKEQLFDQLYNRMI